MEDAGYQAPASDGSSVQVLVSPTSDRLQLLDSFTAWEGVDLKINNSYASSKEVVCVISGAFAAHRARLAVDLK